MSVTRKAAKATNTVYRCYYMRCPFRAATATDVPFRVNPKPTTFLPTPHHMFANIAVFRTVLRGASACQVIGLVWLGSQATKPVRLALAALTAPAADRLIAFTQRRLGLKKKNAVSLLVAAIFGSTVAFCLAVLAYGAARAAVVSTVASAGPPSSSAAFLIRRRMVQGQQ